MWTEAANTAIHILNRTPSKLCETTPYEQWTGERPYLSHVETFRCIAYVHTPDQKRTKLRLKSHIMIFVGFDENSTDYHSYNPQNRKITTSCYVLFDEQQYGFVHEDENIPVLFKFTNVNDIKIQCHKLNQSMISKKAKQSQNNMNLTKSMRDQKETSNYQM